jgi:hypothetical protein
MYDLGESVTIAADVRDSDGDLANAATVTLTITLPDGTTATPVVANPPTVTGQYTVAYIPAQAGRYTWRFVAETPADAYADVFDVREAGSRALVSLADAKAHLNIAAANTTNDAELREHIESVTDVIEDICGPVARRTVVETYSGCGQPAIALNQTPIVSVTSVTESGQAVAASGYSLSDGGVLTRVSGYTATRWTAGVNNIVITYVVGRPVVTASIREGAKELIRVNFRPQLGGNYSPFDGGRGDDTRPGNGERRLGFFVPHRVMQLLNGNERLSGMA